MSADTAARRRCVGCDNVSMGAVPEGWRCPVCRGVMKRWPKRLIVMSEDGVDVIEPGEVQQDDGFERFQAAEGGPVTTNIDGDEVVG